MGVRWEVGDDGTDQPILRSARTKTKQVGVSPPEAEEGLGAEPGAGRLRDGSSAAVAAASMVAARYCSEARSRSCGGGTLLLMLEGAAADWTTRGGGGGAWVASAVASCRPRRAAAVSRCLLAARSCRRGGGRGWMRKGLGKGRHEQRLWFVAGGLRAGWCVADGIAWSERLCAPAHQPGRSRFGMGRGQGVAAGTAAPTSRQLSQARSSDGELRRGIAAAVCGGGCVTVPSRRSRRRRAQCSRTWCAYAAGRTRCGTSSQGSKAQLRHEQSLRGEQTQRQTHLAQRRVGRKRRHGHGSLLHPREVGLGGGGWRTRRGGVCGQDRKWQMANGKEATPVEGPSGRVLPGRGAPERRPVRSSVFLRSCGGGSASWAVPLGTRPHKARCRRRAQWWAQQVGWV